MDDPTDEPQRTPSPPGASGGGDGNAERARRRAAAKPRRPAGAKPRRRAGAKPRRAATRRPPPTRTGRVRIGAIAALGVAAALVAWLLLGSGGKDGGSAQPPPADARAATVADLRNLAATQGGPVYWVGPHGGVTYELSTTSEGSVFVRYLPEGFEIGDERGALTVATYPLADAYAALERAAKEPGAISTRVGRGLAVFDTERPSNVYLAYPRSDRQIEVYAPTPKDARDAVFGGEVRQIPKGSGAPVLAGPAALRRAPAAVGHPVYWAGPRAATSYELTRAADGVVFVRYLPAGTAAGDPAGHLTVATYPLADPAEALRRAAAAEDAQLTSLSGGGLLLTSQARPSNAYVAYPGADVQVEVYDPEPGRAAALVRSGRIAPL